MRIKANQAANLASFKSVPGRSIFVSAENVTLSCLGKTKCDAATEFHCVYLPTYFGVTILEEVLCKT